MIFDKKHLPKRTLHRINDCLIVTQTISEFSVKISKTKWYNLYSCSYKILQNIQSIRIKKYLERDKMWH